jgi:putative restriction endonuclease
MGFGVFIHRSDSIYDDSPAERYQFPKPYLARAQSCVGDWVVYLEPRAVRRARGYFAVARVQQVIPDPTIADMFIAVIEPGSFLEFPSPVAFNDANGPIEQGLLNKQGKLSGRAQAAVRPLSASDFNRIVRLGLNEEAPLLPRIDEYLDRNGFQEGQAEFIYEEPRDRTEQLTSRIVRDRAFRTVVLRAYGERCALTGLRFINGGGRAEVDAAHIKPVVADGPDIVSNGIALSGTAHWMFDRGLISLDDNLRILISRQVNNLDEVRSFVRAEGEALSPQREMDRPHPSFLKWHRDNCFKR